MSARSNVSSPEGGSLCLRFFFFLPPPKTLCVPFSSPVVLAGPSFDPVISGVDRVGGSSDASYLTEGDAGRAEESVVGFGDDGGGSCGTATGFGVEIGAGAEAGAGAGVRTGNWTGGMEIPGVSLLLWFAFMNTLSRRSCIDLPKINLMAAV